MSVVRRNDRAERRLDFHLHVKTSRFETNTLLVIFGFFNRYKYASASISGDRNHPSRQLCRTAFEHLRHRIPCKT